MSVKALALADEDAWRSATTSPFLDGAHDGSLSPDAFRRWLGQDRLFVEALVRAWGRLLASAPEGDFDLISRGIRAFVDELAWFDSHGAREQDVRAMPAAAAYIDWLDSVTARPYAVAVAAMWAVEASYHDAWKGALPGHERFREFVEHWAASEFGEFVDELLLAADRALASTDVDDADVVQAIDTTLAHEAAFWRMVQSDS